MELALGARRLDIATHPVVMGILNPTIDSYDRGACLSMDAFMKRAEQLAAEGADLLDAGGVEAAPGIEIGEAEELDRMVPAVESLVARLDVPVSVATCRASVARAAYRAGAVMSSDMSGFADPDYLPEAAAAGATVVATHIRLGPRIPDPEAPGDVVVAVRDFLVERARQAEAAGLAPEQIVLDAGLDLGKTWEQSVVLLRASGSLAALGYPLQLSASNQAFLGRLLELETTERREASLAAAALGASLGCRILRVHDVAGTVKVRRIVQAILEAAG